MNSVNLQSERLRHFRSEEEFSGVTLLITVNNLSFLLSLSSFMVVFFLVLFCFCLFLIVNV